MNAKFLGRNGAPGSPAALRRGALMGRFGAGLDPCAALQVSVDLGPGESRQIGFTLGRGRDRAHAEELAERHGSIEAMGAARRDVSNHWDQILNAIQVKTPDDSSDVMMNG